MNFSKLTFKSKKMVGISIFFCEAYLNQSPKIIEKRRDKPLFVFAILSVVAPRPISNGGSPSYGS